MRDSEERTSSVRCSALGNVVQQFQEEAMRGGECQNRWLPRHHACPARIRRRSSRHHVRVVPEVLSSMSAMPPSAGTAALAHNLEEDTATPNDAPPGVKGRGEG